MNKDQGLPVNATPLERAWVAATARATDLPVEIQQVWDPNRCPEPLLPWLAWALSVDTWNAQWPLTTKRRVIADSVQVHRTKGTVAAIRRLLQALGLQAELQEWFEYGGPAHTFKVRAWAHDNTAQPDATLLSPHFFPLLKRSIDQVKPVRSHYHIQVGGQFQTGVQMAAMSSGLQTLSRRCDLSVPVCLSPARLGYAAAMTSCSLVRRTMEAP